jgi:Spy/CpxP family protein refolding chaperone
MKIKIALVIAASAAALQLIPAVHAEDSQKHFGGRKDHHGLRDHFASLTEEEKSRLKAAHQKAMEEADVKAAHEKLKAARQEFHQAMKAAMLKADPTIQPLLEKAHPAGGPDEPDNE